MIQDSRKGLNITATEASISSIIAIHKEKILKQLDIESNQEKNIKEDTKEDKRVIANNTNTEISNVNSDTSTSSTTTTTTASTVSATSTTSATTTSTTKTPALSSILPERFTKLSNEILTIGFDNPYWLAIYIYSIINADFRHEFSTSIEQIAHFYYSAYKDNRSKHIQDFKNNLEILLNEAAEDRTGTHGVKGLLALIDGSTLADIKNVKNAIYYQIEIEDVDKNFSKIPHYGLFYLFYKIKEYNTAKPGKQQIDSVIMLCIYLLMIEHCSYFSKIGKVYHQSLRKMAEEVNVNRKLLANYCKILEQWGMLIIHYTGTYPSKKAMEYQLCYDWEEGARKIFIIYEKTASKPIAPKPAAKP